MTNNSKFYYEQVYEVVAQIPRGKVTTYGNIADYLALGSARMVGYALRNYHAGYGEIPAHRVVNAAGVLSGRLHFPTPDFMANQLESEGVKVKHNKVVKIQNYLWVPANELL
ncbi:MGMT family protein [Membranihabitans maritimus]|uniref:MGMT family protein n=1 Tax=Membranihabitans maritimus TaxID=2904244 RepID=UPI001F02EE49|nr:MGMT family protein [Membranihabitans maritimus]